MFSSRNIHFMTLGIILGAFTGYVFAFYQAEQEMPARPAAQSSGMPQGHPDVSSEQMVAMFNTALQKNPNDPTLMARYGDFLSDTDQFQQAVDMYRKVLAVQPDNITVQTNMGTALWNLGKRDEAVATYEKSLKADPNHLATLYYLALVDVDNHNVESASQRLAKIEKIDPKQPALETLRKRIEEERNKAR